MHFLNADARLLATHPELDYAKRHGFLKTDAFLARILPQSLLLLLVILGANAYSDDQERELDQLLEMDLADLLQIKVKSSRSDEQFREVPNSLSIISHSQIDDFQLGDLYDLAYLVPNFSFRRSFGRWQERPAMRGVTAIVGDSSVGLLIDGISAEDTSTVLPLFDSEQVEVLRGPEAAMFGRSTFNGAINFVSIRPTEGVHTQAELQTQEHSGYAVKLLSNLGNKRAALRLSALLEDRDSFESNQLGDGGGGYGEQTSAYTKLSGLWKVTDKLELYAYYNLIDTDDGMLPVYLQNASENNCFLETSSQYYCGKVETPNEIGFSRRTDLWNFGLDKDIERAHIELNYKHQRFDLRLVHANSGSKLQTSYDGDFYELNSVFNSTGETSDTQSTELFSNFYFDNVRILVGLSHYEADVTHTNTRAILFDDSLSLTPSSEQSSHIENDALFGSLDISLPFGMRMLLDARYSIDNVSFETAENISDEAKWKGLQPRLSVSKELNSQWLSYVALAKGIKPGGFNAGLANLNTLDSSEQQRVNTFLFYDQEGIVNLELGFKATLFDKRLLLNTSLFAYEWDDLQLSQSLDYLNADNDLVRARILDNGGRARGLGTELELNARINDNWNLMLNHGYADTNLQNTQTSAQESLTGSGNVDGNEIPVAPKHTSSLAALFSKGLTSSWSVNASATLRYESKRWVAEHNLAYAPASIKLDAKASIKNDNLEVFVWGKNLTDERSPESVARFGDAATFFVRRGFAISIAEPRTIGVGTNILF